MDTPTTNLAEPAQLDIPPAPDVLTAIAREAESDMPNLAKLAKMIQQDPALAAAGLRAANGIMRMRKIESVAQALQVIGLERTHQIVLHALLHSTLGMPKNLRPSLWDELRVSAEAAADFARRLRTLCQGPVVPLAQSFLRFPALQGAQRHACDLAGRA